MGNLLFNVRVRYLNWRLRDRSCRNYCGQTVAGKAVFCSTTCRDSWHKMMQEI